ncbi:MAG: HAD hydrolase family protein [Burkholderiales bacterium]|nr:HAD hydrolase family protein [Burkholderiales bacterium]
MLLNKAEVTQLKINSGTKKTFVFDLDGTIIYDGFKLTEDFESVLANIVTMGHRIYFATGRSYRDFVPMLPDWCTNFPSVVFGGGLVVNRGDIVHQKFLPSDVISNLCGYLDSNDVPYLIDSHQRYFHSKAESWILPDILRISGQNPSNDLDVLLSDGIYKILILNNEYSEHCTSLAKEHGLEIKFHSYNNCFDIMPSGVNKYDGIKYLPLSNHDDIFVFGNDHNDLELMQNFHNSVMFGNFSELLPYAKVKIAYDEDKFANFESVVNTILAK